MALRRSSRIRSSGSEVEKPVSKTGIGSTTPTT